MTNEIIEKTYMFKVKLYPSGEFFIGKPFPVGKDRFVKGKSPKKVAESVELGQEVLL